MEIISEADSLIGKLLGTQRKKQNTDYRMIKWSTAMDFDGGRLIHNYLTGESVFFDKNEKINEDYLISAFFMVPVQNDDAALIDDLRAAYRLFDSKKSITSFKILTTTDCNADCFYCYERGIGKITMSPETALQTADYIEKKCLGEKVTLAWFGGEPLMCTDAIRIITESLKSKGISFTSVMTSNGYLFDKELTDEAALKWNLKNIQITLDGTRDIYNRVKAYKNACDNPFERVLQNIEGLLDKDIHVNIRLNASLKNAEDIKELINVLDKRFSGEKKPGLYVSGLFEELENKKGDEKERLSRALEEIREKIESSGLKSGGYKPLKLRVSGCMADNDNHRGISPLGGLMKCEHFIYDRLIGDINADNEDEKLKAAWKTPMEKGNLCDDCEVRPACYRLEMCPVSFPCDKYDKEEHIKSGRRAIYQSWLAAKNKNLTKRQ